MDLIRKMMDGCIEACSKPPLFGTISEKMNTYGKVEKSCLHHLKYSKYLPVLTKQN